VLICVSIAAGLAVGAGIVLESPKYSARVHALATRLVIVGVVVESLCMVLLFTIDEAISGAQQSKIIALEAKLTPRALSAEQEANITKATHLFSGQKYVLFVALGDKPSALLCEINKSLEDAGWKSIPPTAAVVDITVGTACGDVGVTILSGVHIRVATNFDPEVGKAADALGIALLGDGIAATGERDPKNVPDPATIAVMVGAKP